MTMTDFFISYTGKDKSWAEWIAYVLEEEGYKVIIQAWDFRPGSNFVVAMQDAATNAERTIMVLTNAYLKSTFAEPEWTAAFAQDPKGLQKKLVPVAVEDVGAPGLLSSVVQIRIEGMDEDTARSTLIAGINRERAKPSARPIFPRGRQARCAQDISRIVRSVRARRPGCAIRALQHDPDLEEGGDVRHRQAALPEERPR